MRKIRVLLANHPLMAPDAIRQLVAEQEDMEVVGDCRGPMKILQEVGRTKADAVILTHDGAGEPGLCSQLLAVYPDLTILVLASDMGSGTIQQLCASQRRVPNPQIKDIVNLLRIAVREPCGGERN